MPRKRPPAKKAPPVTVPQASIDPLNEKRKALHAGARNLPATEDPALVSTTTQRNSPIDPPLPTEGPHAGQRESDFLPPPDAGKPRYESRISIVDAYRYPGTLKDAPEWIDRNWAGFADADDLRGIPAGPCLRVPHPADPNNPAQVVLCRVGDYVAQQSIMLAHDAAPIIRTEVWASEQFQRLFIPVGPQASSTAHSPTPPGSIDTLSPPESQAPRKPPLMTPGFQDASTQPAPTNPRPTADNAPPPGMPDEDIEEMPPYAPLTSTPPAIPENGDGQQGGGESS